jgi:hypothetical protein
MAFSERFLAGFALAATIAKDPGADKARAGLCASSAEPLTRVARELRELPKDQRRARVSGWMQTMQWLQPAHDVWPSTPEQPVRAYALLAASLQRAARDPRTANRPRQLPGWLTALTSPSTTATDATTTDATTLPLTRAGYRPDPQLIALLQRIALMRPREGTPWGA